MVTNGRGGKVMKKYVDAGSRRENGGQCVTVGVLRRRVYHVFEKLTRMAYDARERKRKEKERQADRERIIIKKNILSSISY